MGALLVHCPMNAEAPLLFLDPGGEWAGQDFRFSFKA
jgi:hypothetical protein